MDPIKLAFDKIKEDILSLRDEIQLIKQQISNLNLKQEQQIINQINQTSPTQNLAHNDPLASTPTQNPTHQTPLNSSISQNMPISIGNRGVPTDTSTNKPTNQHPDTYSVLPSKTSQINQFSELERVSELLSSLDSLKKEVRLKFKRLTPQEMQVFSTLYTLEEQGFDDITYKIISQTLNLSESSIRDYTTKLINKGIPIKKVKQNNKTIILKISQDLKKIANLSTINKLREL